MDNEEFKVKQKILQLKLKWLESFFDKDYTPNSDDIINMLDLDNSDINSLVISYFRFMADIDSIKDASVALDHIEDNTIVLSFPIIGACAVNF